MLGSELFLRMETGELEGYTFFNEVYGKYNVVAVEVSATEVEYTLIHAITGLDIFEENNTPSKIRGILTANWRPQIDSKVTFHELCRLVRDFSTTETVEVFIQHKDYESSGYFTLKGHLELLVNAFEEEQLGRVLYEAEYGVIIGRLGHPGNLEEVSGDNQGVNINKINKDDAVKSLAKEIRTPISEGLLDGTEKQLKEWGRKHGSSANEIAKGVTGIE